MTTHDEAEDAAHDWPAGTLLRVSFKAVMTDEGAVRTERGMVGLRWLTAIKAEVTRLDEPSPADGHPG